MLKEQRKLEHCTCWSGSLENLFETEAGHFWSILETRPYMRARICLVQQLIYCGETSPLALEFALDHMLDMLRLCRSDNMGLRSKVPHVMLSLGKNQECYDFIKWWGTCDPDGRYDWGDTSLPYLNLSGEDMYEDYTPDSYDDLSHIVALALLKFRLLSISETPDVTDQIKSQLSELLKRGLAHNKRIWMAIINPEPLMSQPTPYCYSMGSTAEAWFVIEDCLPPWRSTPGAIKMLQEKYGIKPTYDVKMDVLAAEGFGR